MKGKMIRTHDPNCHYTILTIHYPLVNRGFVGWWGNNDYFPTIQQSIKVQIASTPTQQKNLISFETVLNHNQ